MPTPTMFGQNQAAAGGGGDPEDILDEFWAWGEPGRETGLSNGDGIATLTDQTGNGRHFTQATEASRPIYDLDSALNGHAVATFNTDRFWNGPDMSGIAQGFGADKQGHVYLIIKADADPPPSGNDTGLHKFTTADNTHYPFTDGNTYDSILKGSRENLGNHTLSLASWRIYEASVIASSATGLTDGEWIYKLDDVHFPNSPGNVVQVQYIAAPLMGKNAANQGFKGKLAGWYLSTQKFSGDGRDDFFAYALDRFNLSV